jgi:hypothetical protein
VKLAVQLTFVELVVELEELLLIIKEQFSSWLRIIGLDAEAFPQVVVSELVNVALVHCVVTFVQMLVAFVQFPSHPSAGPVTYPVNLKFALRKMTPIAAIKINNKIQL